jgi:hypothetical protein
MLGILTVGVASCSLFDVEIDTTFEGDLQIEVDEPVMKSTTAEGYPFEASDQIDVLDDEDVYEYQDKIDDFIVSGVTVSVTSVTPSQGRLYQKVRPLFRHTHSSLKIFTA